ncbi:MAG: hypothetical protein WCN92_02850 [Eubacteriales bacterium]
MNYYFNRNNTLNLRDNFSAESLIAKLNKFSNEQKGMNVITMYDGREICSTEVSKVYFNFDFSGFCKDILGEITRYFTPEYFSIRVASGVQELRLVGGEVIIDNEPYKKFISIINSTDKTRALTMSVGLMRNKNRAYSILTSFSNKHYKSSLPDKIKEFSDNLINFNLNIDYHIKTIEDLKGKTVSFKDFLRHMMFKTEIGQEPKPIKTVGLKMRALGYKLIYDMRMYEHRSFLYNCGEFNRFEKYPDFNIDSKVLYDNYTACFVENDSSVIARETRRVLDALSECTEVVPAEVQ